MVQRSTLAICLSLAAAATVSAQTADNVAVVINDASEASRQVGQHYINARGIPAANVIRIRTVDEETIDGPVYVSTIQQPIIDALTRRQLQDRVLYIVLTKGVPLRIKGTTGPEGTRVSVDSELTLLYRRMVGTTVPTEGQIDNPYFLGSRPIAAARVFTRRDLDIFLVTRLDAFTVKEALAMVDRAMAPRTDGRIVLDQRDALVNRIGDDWMAAAAKRLTEQGEGDRVVLESSVKAARDIAPVLGYSSWGSVDPENRVRRVQMGFVPGALATLIESFTARTFQEPSPDWYPPADITDRTKWHVGAPTSLAADLIREGVTGIAGSVAEQPASSTVRPEILFPAYLAGFNLAESFYLATPHLSWQTVVIGDPLCAPFRQRLTVPVNIADRIDPDTRLPALFAGRRLAAVRSLLPQVPEKALTLVIRAQSLLSLDDLPNARVAFEEATRLVPNSTPWLLQLASIYTRLGEHQLAAARYAQVLKTEPRNVAALNNLAYTMAVHLKQPAEALPLAQRAGLLSKGNPVIVDTVAWIEHLLGNHDVAAKIVGLAVKGAPDNAQIRLHAAIIHTARGDRAAAESELREALRLDPALEASPDVMQLRPKLKRPKK